MKQVLFLCVGNSCRSQMAEGFAKYYGRDVMKVASAGLSPAPIVQPCTFEVMEEKSIKLDGQFPKDLGSLNIGSFELLVNMSGVKLPSRVRLEIRDWKVEDPIGQPIDVYREIRDQIEQLVMRLILELRRPLRARPQMTPSKVLARLGRRPR